MNFAELSSIIAPLAVIQALLAWWIQARITNSIKHEYDKKLEEFKREQVRREKAAVVAEFLAEWTHLKGSDTKRLNQLLWELTIYLPSNLVRDVKSMTSATPGCKTSSEVLIAVRDHLLGANDPLRIDDITYFKHPENPSMKANPSNGA
jgi:hypothetical protein